MRRAFSSGLLVTMLATCAHHPPPPPPGMARVILSCCQGRQESHSYTIYADIHCHRMRPDASIAIDGRDAGRCADWGGDGKIVSAGEHSISASVPHPVPLVEAQCCDGYALDFTLRAGEVSNAVMVLQGHHRRME